MKYKRNRTETLTLRLTPKEKELLKQKAAARCLTLTDYILLSALEYSDAQPYRLILKQLGDLRTALQTLQQKKESDDLRDLLAMQSELYNTLIAAIRSK
ncbi:MAG: DUF1778 domain-containing protein [Clostridia bacterium]|nr:DUF1778 domain-containing protein [Clostridia bacterium]